MAKIDIHQHVTDTIIAEIEAGTPPWRKPWTGDSAGARFPVRHNGETYRGINVLILWIMAETHGFTSARWMTFKQAQALGGMVRKGQKATKSVFYGTYEREVEGSDGENETRTSRFAKCFNVFNADQIDDLPEDYYICPEPPRDLGTECDPELDQFFARLGVDIISSDDPRAYFSPAKDQVHIPPVETFYSASKYYGVLAHECCHWTGVEKRLGRFGRFQDREGYAFEELVAELGSAYLAVHLRIEPHFDQSAAYIEGWLKALKDDKTLIFKAASEAQKAVDYILDRASQDERAAA